MLRRWWRSGAVTPAEGAAAVGMIRPFFLPYQGCDDRLLQAAHGSLVAEVMAAAYPRWATCARRPLQSGERIRIGFVSGCFGRRHSVWRIPMRGWVENFDRDRLQLFGYLTRSDCDDQTDQARVLFDRFRARSTPIVSVGGDDRARRATCPGLSRNRCRPHHPATRCSPACTCSMHFVGPAGYIWTADNRLLPVQRFDGAARRPRALHRAPCPIARPRHCLQTGVGRLGRRTAVARSMGGSRSPSWHSALPVLSEHGEVPPRLRRCSSSHRAGATRSTVPVRRDENPPDNRATPPPSLDISNARGASGLRI